MNSAASVRKIPISRSNLEEFVARALGVTPFKSINRDKEIVRLRLPETIVVEILTKEVEEKDIERKVFKIRGEEKKLSQRVR